MESGDSLVLYTDGVTEVCNAHEEEFGEERLLNVLTGSRGRSAREIQERILLAAAEFSKRVWNDDATLLVLRVH